MDNKTYKLNLTWKPKTLQYYGEVQSAQIFDGQYLRIMDNGEGFFNLHRYDSDGNEIYDSIGAAQTVLAAQKIAENWLDEQLKEFMVEV